jgi:lipid-binding SYLF domain-containing protein
VLGLVAFGLIGPIRGNDRPETEPAPVESLADRRAGDEPATERTPEQAGLLARRLGGQSTRQFDLCDPQLLRGARLCATGYVARMNRWIVAMLVFSLVFSLGCGSEKTEETAGAQEPTKDSEPQPEESPPKKSEASRQKVDLSAVTGAEREAMQAMIGRSRSMNRLFEEEYGFAIFPTVGKGGFIVGGGGGAGSVYERGKLIGTAKLKFLSVGAQVGGQSYIEVIFFENKASLDKFTSDSFEFGAQATAIAVTAGAAADADYQDGIAVFTMPKKGLMAEASVSGQKFKYKAK